MIHEEKSIFSNQQGEELVGLLSMPNDHAPIVIIAHGLGSSKDGSVYLGLQHGLNAHGIGSFRFDFFGHGESSGKFQDITLSEGVANVEAAFQYLHGRFKHVPICLCGSSFGGSRRILCRSNYQCCRCCSDRTKSLL
jgi:predicted alpha/beta-fold hydrolase